MRNMIHFTSNPCVRLGALVLCAGLLNGRLLGAGEAKTVTPPIQTPAEDPIYSNWLNLTIGGLIPRGNEAQFRQNNPTLGPIFGGIDDMHLEKTVGSNTFMSLDAHAIFADSDYKVKFELSQPDVGYVRAGFTEFCTYSNGNGGYLPSNAGLPNGLFLAGPEFALYRGSIWIELGLRAPHLPEITLRYERAFRFGQEDSTSWGTTTQTGLAATPTFDPNTNNVGRKMVPSFRNINETRDIFTFDGKQLFGKPEAFGNTELNLGMRYEFDNTKNSLNVHNQPGDPPTSLKNNLNNIPLNANDYYISQADQLSLALYSGHVSTVTRFGDKLWLTSAYSYSAESSNISGSRIAGPNYGVPYSPYYNNTIYANRGSAYIDLGGGSSVGVVGWTLGHGP